MLGSVFFMLAWHIVGLIFAVIIMALIDTMEADVPKGFGAAVLIVCLPVIALLAALITIFDRNSKEESE